MCCPRLVRWALELPTNLREDFTMSEVGVFSGHCEYFAEHCWQLYCWSLVRIEVSFTGSQEFNPRQLCKMIFKSANKFTVGWWLVAVGRCKGNDKKIINRSRCVPVSCVRHLDGVCLRSSYCDSRLLASKFRYTDHIGARAILFSANIFSNFLVIFPLLLAIWGICALIWGHGNNEQPLCWPQTRRWWYCHWPPGAQWQY